MICVDIIGGGVWGSLTNECVGMTIRFGEGEDKQAILFASDKKI
jgi:hypothetical protein